MELRQLRYFVTLAEEMHFGRAAERLCITQPPLSAAIIQLETELGARLFERDHRHVSLTKAGEMLLPRAQGMLSQAERTKAFAKAIVSGRSGRLEIGFTGSMLYRGLQDIVSAFCRGYPDIDLSLREMNSQQQAHMIRAGRLDAGFINAPLPPERMNSLMVCEERLCACLPVGHPLAREQAVDVGALRDESFVIFSREASPVYYEQLVGLCIDAGFQPRLRFEVGQISTGVAFVASQLCVSIVPESMRRAGTAGVVFVPLKQQAVRSSAYLVWLPEVRTPGLEAFLSTIREMASLPAEMHDFQHCSPVCTE